MKFLAAIFFLCFSISSFGAPCKGAPGAYRPNPDGSMGGFVQNTAKVASQVYLDSSSEVCDKVQITGNAEITSGSRIEGNVKIEGSPVIKDSHIYSYAMIKGKSVIQESEVCQGSLIDGFKVIKSDYYCQTEDPEPRHPGAEGLKTLLGVDSDGDGVRDDVEIFINKKLSNTPQKSYKTERQASKIYAGYVQKSLLLKDNVEKLNTIYQSRVGLIRCFNFILDESIQVEMHNTEERVLAFLKIISTHNGKQFPRAVGCKTLQSHSDFIRRL